MNICMFCRVVPDHGRGGMQDVVFDSAKNLVKIGHYVSVITTRHPKGTTEKIVNGVKIYFLNKTRSQKYGADWDREAKEKLVNLHTKQPSDIVHTQGMAAIWLPRFLKEEGIAIPTIISLHGTYWDELKTSINVMTHPKTFFSIVYSSALILLFLVNHLKTMFRIRMFDLVIATSPEQREILRERYFVSSKKIKVVLNGIDTHLFKGGRCLANRGISLLVVARLNEEKGAHIALQAVKELTNLIRDIQLIIVGDGKDRKYLKSTAAKLGISNFVHFVGFVPLTELPEYYRSCDIFLNPTLRQNGYDLTILQAMASGKPVITTNIGSYPTAIDSGKEGFLTSLGDINDLVEKILILYKNKQLALDMGKNGNIKVEKMFTSKQMAKNLELCYLQLTKK